MNELWSYAATRLLRLRIVALWLLCLGTVVLVHGLSRSLVPVASLLLVQAAALLLVQVCGFRLLDDLMDRERDRRLHPHRVLCTAQELAGVRLACAGLLAVAPLSWGPQDARSVAYALFLAALLALYGLTRRAQERDAAGWGRALRVQGVLLKYPLFVTWATGAPWPSASASLWPVAALYLVLSAHEWWPRLRASTTTTAGKLK